ncbi:Ribosomal RNA small subunit methyltransferase I [Aquimixticola soesokkakensis]|uniref:Ribosomal RNA small subunit methyltransferase I n=1 Tax=Aquimixticola soesokkakensis TaxID=1519096 RepID=A0A1Y5T0H9_9RHOB|nr:16S rRNA (cytidine(1402)-2'-O)-methyltransferase [Aquimixticola soesokkakensis]SLN53152.1 Ribosomal RNA small subunit methyltransferase I [Aquimixticola soesokkakensis]
MSYQIKPLPAGLHFVATPIGTARDITLRGLDTLASADVLAAEDTRTLKHLMEIHGVPLGDRHVYAYHDHNGAQVRPHLIAAMKEGKSVAYASEAGTPLVADPGFALAREAIAQGIAVTSAPGPSAVVAALSISGLPSDRFLFAGFLPSTSGAAKKVLSELRDIPATLCFYESPKRIAKTLASMCEVLGEARPAALCREITKRFEEVRRGTLRALCDDLAANPVKGEIVLLVDRGSDEAAEEDIEAALDAALLQMSVKDAATLVAEKFNLPRRQIYQSALARGKAAREA